MKFFSCLILFTIFGVLSASDCGCKETCRRKIKVKDDHDPEIKVIYTGTPCACQKALPFRVEKPIIPKEKLSKHKYDVHIKEEKPEPVCRYIYNTKVEKPVVEKEVLSQYPIRVEKLLEECKNHPRFIYSVKIEKPEEKCETQLDGLVAKMDKIVMPLKDCPQPCCHPSGSSEEVPKNKIKKTAKKPVNKKHVQYPESSEEILEESSEETCTKYKPAPSKTKACRRCKVVISEEEGCGCGAKDSSSSEEVQNSSSSEEGRVCSVEVQTSGESCEYKPSKEQKEYCSKEAQTSSSEESSEETPKSCQEYSSEETCSCGKPIPSSSSEESHESCGKSKYDSSEEIRTQSSEEHACPCKSKKCESSEEIQVQSSEEYTYPSKTKKCESSEEIQVESSEETNCEDDHGQVSDEEHWCKGKPIKIYSKRFRYSNSDDSSKRFSRYKREFFLDDMQDFSVYTEPLTRNEIQRTIAKLRANSTMSSGKRKKKRRPRNRHLVQNKDQFEEHNKLKQMFEAKTIDAAEEKNTSDDEEVIVNGKPRILESNPKELEEKLVDEVLLKEKEDRNKRHSKCRTIERLRKHPKYDLDVLADAGCSQYIPEIINRNKRHLSTYDGNINIPIRFVDATKSEASPHPFHLKKIQYRRHHHHPKHVKEQNLQNQGNFAVDPKFYYKYLSLTAPDLSANRFNAKSSEADSPNGPEDKKIVFDHLGHKFLEYNGFRTLIKPKIEYIEEYTYEKPKFWTCKEDLIDPKDFGKVTTISEETETITEPTINSEATTEINTIISESTINSETTNEINTTISEDLEAITESTIILGTTTEINLETEQTPTEEATEATTTETLPKIEDLEGLEDLEAHEANLCEYLKKLDLSQNLEEQEEAKNAFLHNCQSYIKFLVFNPSKEEKSSNPNITEYLENLLQNTHLKSHFKKLFHTKHKFENSLANITKLLHKPKVLDNFKNYLLFQNEFDSMKTKLDLIDYTIFNFYVDLQFILNIKFEKLSTTTERLSTIN